MTSVCRMAKTLREARQRFFADNGFGADGGYDDAWQDAAFGRVPYSVPNPAMRSAALQVHDLHHPLTGYGADWRGEAQISAWELGSGGGGRYAYAWFIALFGLLTGLLALPRATWRAFVRGRASRNLYRESAPLRRLDSAVSAVRAELALNHAPRPAQWGDRLAFVGWSTLAAILAVAFVSGIPALIVAAGLRRLVPSMRCPLSWAFD